MHSLFCRYFSIQGISIKYLHENGDLQFDATAADIEVFISGIEQTERCFIMM